MKFIKMHGTGNDFVVVDAQSGEEDWPALARKLCHRHFGVGADGLLLIMPSTVAEVRMRMFNPDGSEAEACGNGLRCMAKYVVERGLAPPAKLRVETMAGIRQVWLQMDGGRATGVRVAMGRPQFHPSQVPVELPGEGPIIDYPLEVTGHQLSLTCLSMGNPHAVHFTNGPVADFPLAEVGPLVEHHPLFPHRVNFEVVRVLDGSRAEARVWERGAGETLACGSGACAIAVAGLLKGLTSPQTEIILPGGRLSLEWDGEGEVYLSGPAEEVFRGEWRE